MRPIGKDITKHYQIACSSMSYTLFAFYRLMFIMCLFPLFLTHRSHYPGNRFKRSLSK